MARRTAHVSDHEQLVLISSVEARDERRRQKLGEVALPTQPLRGKRRISAFEYRTPSRREPLPFNTVQRLGKALKDEPILVDELTKYYNPRPFPSDIEAYVNGAVKRNSQKGSSSHEWKEIFKNKRRAFEHAADQLQRVVRTQKDNAIINRAALANVQRSIHEEKPVHPIAGKYAAAAIEDFGICLRERYELADSIDKKSDLPTYFEELGLYAADNPEELRNHYDVLRLVRLEQAKREAHWTALHEVVVDEFDDRRTQADRVNDDNTAALLASFEAEPKYLV